MRGVGTAGVAWKPGGGALVTYGEPYVDGCELAPNSMQRGEREQGSLLSVRPDRPSLEAQEQEGDRVPLIALLPGSLCPKDYFAMATKTLLWLRVTRRATASWLSALAIASRTSCTDCTA